MLKKGFFQCNGSFDRFLLSVGNYNLPSLDATGKDVIVIGGGDTGVDCIGTSLRQVRLMVIT